MRGQGSIFASLTLAALAAVAAAVTGDPIDDLVAGFRHATHMTPAEGVALTFDSVVSGAHWRDGDETRALNSDFGDADRAQPVGLRSVLEVGAWDFSFAPTWWVAGPWTAAAATNPTAADDPLLSQWDVEQWRVNAGIGWHLDERVEVRTQYSYTKDPTSDAVGEHLFDLRVSFSF